MSSNARGQDEMLARITELARDAWSAQADFARQSIELGRATLTSEVDPTTAGRAWVEAVSREGARYWKDVGELGLDVAGSLVAIGSRSMARVIADTRSATRSGARAGTQAGTRAETRTGTRAGTGRGPAPGPPSHAAHRDGDRHGAGDAGDLGDPGDADEQSDVVITRPAAESGAAEAHADTGAVAGRAAVTLHGRPGDTATGRVTLSNAHPRARKVLLSAGRLQPDSGRHVELELRLDPDGVTIPAGSEHDVLLEVDLKSDVVRPGERYEGVILVTGGVEAELDVAVVVEE
ncbi:hypothetical protein GCM10009721_12320 [Terrabacter tumescens]|uniref:Uncharacterized protein n=1 Tax=Terrabacter tumescens TaxID=60443 RepID=A0ABQ2HQK2_9MICO|nr:hypothetical protein [Terrabacter tumescens]GGM88751.1 hypothetical protein GCM10009721_12320 [Terrabacter tumescens]